MSKSFGKKNDKMQQLKFVNITLMNNKRIFMKYVFLQLC